MGAATPTRWRRWCLVPLFVLGLAASATSSRATFIRQYSLPELWSLADCVVEGFVDSVTYGLHPVNSAIVTHVHLNVTVVHQGSCAPGPRVITQAGGRSGSIGLVIPSMPGFAAGEHVLLFLDEYPGLLFPVLALDQGKFTITLDPRSGTQVLSNRHHRAIDPATFFGELRRPGGAR